MDNQLNSYFKHAVSSDWWAKDTKGMTYAQMFQNFKNRPVCPRCEKWAYRDKGWSKGNYARCPACGWRGRTVTIDEFITNRHYK